MIEHKQRKYDYPVDHPNWSWHLKKCEDSPYVASKGRNYYIFFFLFFKICFHVFKNLNFEYMKRQIGPSLWHIVIIFHILPWKTFHHMHHNEEEMMTSQSILSVYIWGEKFIEQVLFWGTSIYVASNWIWVRAKIQLK